MTIKNTGKKLAVAK